VAGTTVHAEGGAMVYDRGAGTAAYDGLDVVAGAELMDVDGALRFVKGTGGAWAGYDANGNMTARVVDGQAFLLTWDHENRLTQVNQGASTVAQFGYDGDGRRVKGTVNGTTTAYVGDYYELTGGTARKYYTHWGRRIAMQEGGTLYWLVTDHLGSTAIVTGTTQSEVRYDAWGADRYTAGNMHTTYRFTGQRYESRVYPRIVIPESSVELALNGLSEC